MAGLDGVLAAPLLSLLKKNKTFQTISALVVLVTVLVWAVTFYTSLWGHLASFAKWVPVIMAKSRAKRDNLTGWGRVIPFPTFSCSRLTSIQTGI